jgi:hypothetical protein
MRGHKGANTPVRDRSFINITITVIILLLQFLLIIITPLPLPAPPLAGPSPHSRRVEWFDGLFRRGLGEDRVAPRGVEGRRLHHVLHLQLLLVRTELGLPRQRSTGTGA